MTMATATMKTWTAEEIAELFKQAHDEADEATRDATRGPFNPYGDKFESLVWHGSIREAQEDDRLDWVDWIDREGDSNEFNAFSQGAFEQALVDQASIAIGTGRPIYIAFYDGQFPTVFCKQAAEDAVQEGVDAFYGE
jgi:hypothetical protein